VKLARKYLLTGDCFVVEIDIENYFDNINHNLLLTKLQRYINDKCVLTLIDKFLNCRVEKDFTITYKTRGIVQGSPLSPLFSNVFLDDFDSNMQLHGYHFIRFADDIKIFITDYEQGLDIYKEVTEYLKRELYLEINKNKSGVFEAWGRIYLGYQFIRSQQGIEIKQFKREQRNQINQWQSSDIE
jgi:retron-type reverse transcriptase